MDSGQGPKVRRGSAAGGRTAGDSGGDSGQVASGGNSGRSGGRGGWVRGLHPEGMKMRLRSSLTLNQAPEGSESGWIVPRQWPRDPLTLSCEPTVDCVAVNKEPWDSGRGPHKGSRRTQPRELDQVSYNVNESDCVTQENMKIKQSNSILNTKTIKYMSLIHI